MEAIAELNKIVAADTKASIESQVMAWQLLALLDPAASGKLKSHLVDSHRLVQITALRTIARLPGTASNPADEANATRVAMELAVNTADPWLRLEATMSAARSMDSLSDKDRQSAAAGLGQLAARMWMIHICWSRQPGRLRKNAAEFLCSWLDGLGELKADSLSGQVGKEPARDKWLVAAAKQLPHMLKRTSPINCMRSSRASAICSPRKTKSAPSRT